MSVCSYRPGETSRVGRAMTQLKFGQAYPSTSYVGLSLFWYSIGLGPLLEESCFSGSDGVVALFAYCAHARSQPLPFL